jgi:hypothetical protein
LNWSSHIWTSYDDDNPVVVQSWSGLDTLISVSIRLDHCVRRRSCHCYDSFLRTAATSNVKTRVWFFERNFVWDEDSRLMSQRLGFGPGLFDCDSISEAQMQPLCWYSGEEEDMFWDDPLGLDGRMALIRSRFWVWEDERQRCHL